MTDAAESVIDCLLVALAAQLALSKDHVLTPDAAEAFTDLSSDEAKLLFGHAGHLVHYGWDTGSMEALIRAITAVHRAEAPEDAPVKPGDEVTLAESTFTVRHVGPGAFVDVQPDLTDDYVIVTVPAEDLLK